MDISAIDTLEAIIDGDTIVPGMNFVLPSGVGTTQYYNPSTEECTPDYSQAKNQIMLYPYCYSSSSGKFIVPDSGQEMWYLDNPDSESAQILTGKGGSVASKYSKLFQKTTYTVNNQVFPALKIIGNLAGEDSLNDVGIYFKSTFKGMELTCHATISVRESVGSIFDILINCTNEDGLNDTVIDNNSEYLVLDATLLDSGSEVAATGSWSWMKATASGLVAVSHVSGVTELSNSNRTLKLYEGAIEGTEEYFACVVHNGVTYRKGIQVSDTHDPYYIDIGRSQASNMLKENDSVDYTPKVLSRSTRTVQSGWSFAYVIRDNSGSTVRSSNGSKLSVAGTEVHEHGGLNIHITASKS